MAIGRINTEDGRINGVFFKKKKKASERLGMSQIH